MSIYVTIILSDYILQCRDQSMHLSPADPPDALRSLTYAIGYPADKIGV